MTNLNKTQSYSKMMVFTITGMATLMGTFTTSSINIALPLMAADFNLPLNAISWVSTIYILSLSSLLLLSGRLGDLYGNRLIMLLGFGIFALSSGLAVVFANSFGGLLIFRAIQGLGGSMIIAISPALIVKAFPPDERGRAIGINTIFVSLGLSIGPPLGGWLSGLFSWHSLFSINVPLGILGIIATIKFLPWERGSRNKLDILGAVLLSLFICGIILCINFLASYGLFSFPFIAPLAIGIFSFLLFLREEKKLKHPLVKTDLFKNPPIALGSIISLCFYASQMMIVFLLPFYLIDFRGFSSDIAGLIITAMPLSIMFFSTPGGSLGDKFGIKFPAAVGLILVLISTLLLSLLNYHSTYFFMVFSLLLFGVGTGFVTAPVNAGIITSAPEDYRGLVSGLTGALRSVAQALGISLGSLIITSRSCYYAEGDNLLNSGDAFIFSFRDALFFSAFLILIALFAAWHMPGKFLSRKEKQSLK